MIKDVKIRIAVDQRGSITSGAKSEKGYPVSLDHFNVADFPEVARIYGDKPTELVLLFPTDDPKDFFDCEYSRWAKNEKGEGVKLRQCDGETCLHRIQEDIAGTHYEAGQEGPCVCDHLDEDDKGRCNYRGWFKAWVLNPATSKPIHHLCYRFETGSKNSGDAVWSEIEKMRYIRGGVLRGIPFRLTVKMVHGAANQKLKFPIWELRAAGESMEELDQLQRGFLNMANVETRALGPAPDHNVKAPGTETVPTASDPFPQPQGANPFVVYSEELEAAGQAAVKAGDTAPLATFMGKRLEAINNLPNDDKMAVMKRYNQWSAKLHR